MCNQGVLDAALDAIWEARDSAAREALRSALAAVWSGADELDTDAVIDHLTDIGFRVVQA